MVLLSLKQTSTCRYHLRRTALSYHQNFKKVKEWEIKACRLVWTKVWRIIRQVYLKVVMKKYKARLQLQPSMPTPSNDNTQINLVLRRRADWSIRQKTSRKSPPLFSLRTHRSISMVWSDQRRIGHRMRGVGRETRAARDAIRINSVLELRNRLFCQHISEAGAVAAQWRATQANHTKSKSWPPCRIGVTNYWRSKTSRTRARLECSGLRGS